MSMANALRSPVFFLSTAFGTLGEVDVQTTSELANAQRGKVQSRGQGSSSVAEVPHTKNYQKAQASASLSKHQAAGLR